MKLKFILLAFFSLCVNVVHLLAQKSPIEWINKSFTIHVDTTFKKQGQYQNYYEGSSVRFAFKNIGQQVTFVDSLGGNFYNEKYIAKPNEVSEILLSNKINYTTVLKGRDTTIFVNIPFYYDGNVYREKLRYNLTFGKSKLIVYDNLQVDLTEFVSQKIKENPSLIFTHFFTIKNISTKPIYCTKKFKTYNDSGADLGYRNTVQYETILPGESYKIPVEMLMDRKYRFKRYGWIEVFSDDTYEAFRCDLKSDFERE